MKKSARSAGFTFVELIVVITLLGILAALAIPRYADLRGSARAATLQGMVGGTRGAAALAHSTTLAKGLGPNDPIEIEGQTVAMVGAYPDAQGMVAALNLELSDEFQIQYFGNSAFIIYATGVPGWTSCGFAYIRAFPPAIPYPRYFGPFIGNC